MLTTNFNTEKTVMKSKTRRVRSKVRAFTLLEVLMVVVIIGLLAAFVVPNFFGAGEKARKDLTKAIVDSGFNGALDLYRAHMNTYPPSDEGGLQLLMEPPDDEELAEQWAGPYIKKAKDMVDPWGNEYIYEFPGEVNETGYDLSSGGATDDDEDDIVNWEKT